MQNQVCAIRMATTRDMLKMHYYRVLKLVPFLCAISSAHDFISSRLFKKKSVNCI